MFFANRAYSEVIPYKNYEKLEHNGFLTSSDTRIPRTYNLPCYDNQ